MGPVQGHVLEIHSEIAVVRFEAPRREGRVAQPEVGCGELPGQLSLSFVESARVAAATCFSAAAIAGAFCLRLSAVVPLAAVCNSANDVLTSWTLGWRAGEAEASALSRLVLTSAIAVVSAVRPSSAGLTFVRASSHDWSASMSSQAAAVASVVGAAVVAAAVVAGGLGWLSEGSCAARQSASRATADHGRSGSTDRD